MIRSVMYVKSKSNVLSMYRPLPLRKFINVPSYNETVQMR